MFSFLALVVATLALLDGGREALSPRAPSPEIRALERRLEGLARTVTAERVEEQWIERVDRQVSELEGGVADIRKAIQDAWRILRASEVSWSVPARFDARDEVRTDEVGWKKKSTRTRWYQRLLVPEWVAEIVAVDLFDGHAWRVMQDCFVQDGYLYVPVHTHLGRPPDKLVVRTPDGARIRVHVRPKGRG